MDHMGLPDLKNLSETCDHFEKVSWKNRNAMSYIKVRGLFEEADVKVFQNTKKTFENFIFTPFTMYPRHVRPDQVQEYSEAVTNQLTSLKSFKLINLKLRYNGEYIDIK